MSKKLFVHIDADAFFASVEQCIHKELRGKPVVTGRDGSIAIAMSYEAKALGVERGTPTHLIRKEYPEVYMVSSDYQVYKIFSDRMMNIIREYLPQINRTSVDECKSELPYSITSFSDADTFVTEIKKTLEMKLGCTFSFGVATTPLLAKIASAMNKPSGITLVDKERYLQLCTLPIEKVPGFGKRMAPRLRGMGIGTIQQFINNYTRIKQNFSAPVKKIYQELTEVVSTPTIKKPIQSMNRARSFKVTNCYEELRGQLCTNTEYLLRKLRHEDLRAQTIYVTLRDFSRSSYTKRIQLLQASSGHTEIYRQCLKAFDSLYQSSNRYRYVSVTLGGLIPNTSVQLDLFGESKVKEQENHTWNIIDSINQNFGNCSLTTADTLSIPKNLGSHIPQHTKQIHRYPLLPGEGQWRRLTYPFLGKVS